ncbi:MAG: copper chaperone PCu(A)C [Pseudomonadota bacterium]
MKLGLIAAALVAGLPAFADDIKVEDGFALVSRPNAPAGAVFMMLKNTGDVDDTLIGASTSVAERVELHTHIKDGDVMRMREVEGGFEIEANGERALGRGGDHVMLMGLTENLEVGSEIEVTLTFQQAGDLVITVPVKDTASSHGHGSHGHGDHGHGDGDDGEHSGHNH